MQAEASARSGLESLRTAWTEVTAAGPGPPSADDLAKLLMLHFDDYWQAARSVTGGPVDVIDFFSGCGGISAGFRTVNGLLPAFRHVLAVDTDPVSNATYERNIGLRPVAADVHELATRTQRLRKLLDQSGRRPGSPLVLIGCAPCQGFSSHRNGAADDRNELFVDFARIAVRLQPDFIVIENVPELCTDLHWSRVTRVREILESAGYRVHLAVHNLAEFGLPQERFRALMLAARQPFNPPTAFLDSNNFRTVRDAISSLPPIKPGEVHPEDAMHFTAGHRKTTIDMIRSVPKDGGKRSFDTGPPSLIALHARQGKPTKMSMVDCIGIGRRSRLLVPPVILLAADSCIPSKTGVSRFAKRRFCRDSRRTLNSQVDWTMASVR